MFCKALRAETVVFAASLASADTTHKISNTFQDATMSGGSEISTIALNAKIAAKQAATAGTGAIAEGAAVAGTTTGRLIVAFGASAGLTPG